MPISTRRAAERGLLSNYVAGVRIGLPRGEPSASRRIEGIRRQTGRYKRYDNPGAAQRLFFEATPVRLRPKALSAGFSSASVAFTASNIGRLPERLDVLGRPVVAARPLVPLCGGQRLAVVLGGLGETLYVGFIADAGIPHPATLVSLILAELDELEAASHPLPTAHDQNRSLRVRRRDGAN
ncbi:MAG: WS/DGAT domain-containing protein [Frankia sp.]